MGRPVSLPSSAAKAWVPAARAQVSVVPKAASAVLKAPAAGRRQAHRKRFVRVRLLHHPGEAIRDRVVVHRAYIQI